MKRFLIFSLNELRMALPMPAVERILRAVYITPLPNAPEIVLGVINVQGRIIPVIDMHRRLGLPDREIALSDQMIIAHMDRRPVALVANSVMGFAEYPESKLTDVSNVLPEMEQVTGVVKLDDGLGYIHDLDRFLSLEEAASLDVVLTTTAGG